MGFCLGHHSICNCKPSGLTAKLIFSYFSCLLLLVFFVLSLEFGALRIGILLKCCILLLSHYFSLFFCFFFFLLPSLSFFFHPRTLHRKYYIATFMHSEHITQWVQFRKFYVQYIFILSIELHFLSVFSQGNEVEFSLI